MFAKILSLFLIFALLILLFNNNINAKFGESLSYGECQTYGILSIVGSLIVGGIAYSQFSTYSYYSDLMDGETSTYWSEYYHHRETVTDEDGNITEVYYVSDKYYEYSDKADPYIWYGILWSCVAIGGIVLSVAYFNAGKDKLVNEKKALLNIEKDSVVIAFPTIDLNLIQNKNSVLLLKYKF